MDSAEKAKGGQVERCNQRRASREIWGKTTMKEEVNGSKEEGKIAGFGGKMTGNDERLCVWRSGNGHVRKCEID